MVGPAASCVFVSGTPAEGEAASELISEFDATVTCSAEILDVDGTAPPAPVTEVTVTLADGDSRLITVSGADGEVTCSAEAQDTDGTGAEVMASEECAEAVLPAGGSATCTFTVTAFFEGIPALSPAGLALLVLMMLSIGFVGMRRFA